jgi:hypothetical protein
LVGSIKTLRGGKAAGGDTLIAPGYGYESSNARHDQTHFPVASEFYMTFLGPLTFIKPDGSPVALPRGYATVEFWGIA